MAMDSNLFSKFMAWYCAGLAFHLFLLIPVVGVLVSWRSFKKILGVF